jgi:hypothetical protein
MRTFLKCGVLATAILVAAASQAFAWHMEGRVICETTGDGISGVTISVVSTDGGTPFSGSASTGPDGHYWIGLADEPRCYRATLTPGPGETVVNPASGYADFCNTLSGTDPVVDWVLMTPECAEQTDGVCWLTGGGAKFSSITGTELGEHGPRHNWGGNVYPSCSPTPGDGGSWNHLDHELKLHFHGQAITVVRCGNVDGIPPGSESPVTPFNFIEFTGTGTLKGIKGNKADYGTVNFWARCEDRNEPGSSGQQDGNLKDRYFLHVYDDAGTTLLLVDVDGVASTVDPVTITKGNLQIHDSSCDSPPLAMRLDPARSEIQAAGKSSFDGLSFAAGPNPSRDLTFMRFALPREATVSLAAFDISGRMVRQIVSGRLPAGEHSVNWNLRDTSGRRVGSGVYFIRMVVDGKTYGRAVTVMQ